MTTDVLSDEARASSSSTGASAIVSQARGVTTRGAVCGDGARVGRHHAKARVPRVLWLACAGCCGSPSSVPQYNGRSWGAPLGVLPCKVYGWAWVYARQGSKRKVGFVVMLRRAQSSLFTGLRFGRELSTSVVAGGDGRGADRQRSAICKNHAQPLLYVHTVPRACRNSRKHRLET